jgi:hypothetical protein
VSEDQGVSKVIPEDIIEASNQCVAKFRWNNDNQWDRFVASAILAERERCAEIALEWYKCMIWDDGKPKKFVRYSDVADAIRGTSSS